MSATSFTPPQRGEIDAASLDTEQPFSAFGASKILHRHRERLGVVYVRQSNPQQVRFVLFVDSLWREYVQNRLK